MIARDRSVVREGLMIISDRSVFSVGLMRRAIKGLVCNAVNPRKDDH